MEPILTAALKFGPWCLMSFFLVREAFGYIKSRDAAEKSGQADKTRDCEALSDGASLIRGPNGIRNYQVEQAILEISKQTAMQTELLRGQSALLERCVEGHHETQMALEQLKGQMQGLAPRMRN